MKQRIRKRIKNEHNKYSLYKKHVAKQIRIFELFNANENLISMKVPVIVNGEQFLFKYTKKDILK